MVKNEQVEHYCPRHDSTYGYIDEDGKWNCWMCYKEDNYKNPNGTPVDLYTNNGLQARILFVGAHEVKLEVWDITKEPKEMLFDKTYHYLSQATREWAKITNNIDYGRAKFIRYYR